MKKKFPLIHMQWFADSPNVTRVSDIIVPSVFMRYVNQRTAELSRIRSSGILGVVPNLEVPRGGNTVNMPYWDDLDGNSEVWSSGGKTNPSKITAKQDIAAILTRIKSWGAEDLADLFAGDDPMLAIANKVAGFWARDDQATLLSILKGIFASASMTDSILDAYKKVVTNDLLVDAMSLLGDASEGLTGIITHSAVRADLFKKGLITVKPGEVTSQDAPELARFLGRTVIADDGAPVETLEIEGEDKKVYTTYFFGLGAVGYAEGEPKNPVEIERKGTESLDVLINRRVFIMHPRGVKWIGAAAGNTPSNTELATGTNWLRVYETKNIRIVALRHQIGAA